MVSRWCRGGVPVVSRWCTGGVPIPEEGSHHEGKINAEIKSLNRFEIKSFNGIKIVFAVYVKQIGLVNACA